MEFIRALIEAGGKYIVLIIVAIAGVFAGKALRQRKDSKQVKE